MSRSFIINSYNNVNNDRVNSVNLVPLVVTTGSNFIFFNLRDATTDSFNTYTASFAPGTYSSLSSISNALSAAMNYAYSPIIDKYLSENTIKVDDEFGNIFLIL